MNWFWVNVPLMVIFFAAVAGIPLWLVFKHPDAGPLTAVQPGEIGPGRPVPAPLVEPDRVGVAG